MAAAVPVVVAAVAVVAAGADSRLRVLLIAPHGSYRTAPFIDAAHRLKAEVLIASEGRHSLVAAQAQGLHIDFSDEVGALRAIRNEAQLRPFAGIIGTDDSSTELAAQASMQLNLPHNPVIAVRRARRKSIGERWLVLRDPVASELLEHGRIRELMRAVVHRRDHVEIVVRRR